MKKFGLVKAQICLAYIRYVDDISVLFKSKEHLKLFDNFIFDTCKVDLVHMLLAFSRLYLI